MTTGNILRIIFNAKEEDVALVFSEMNPEIFEKAFKEAIEVGDTSIDIVWYNCIELAFEKCFPGVSTELLFMDFDISTHSFGVNIDDIEYIDDFETKCEEFINLTGFDIQY